MMRSRVCATILRADEILMVKHEHNGRSYWTLPGGGIENGETHIQAMIREVQEETHLRLKIIQILFEDAEVQGKTHCYWTELDGLESLKKNRQVSRVLEWLS